jgi:hypothetical protein
VITALRLCLLAIAKEEEREDRFGDLTEAFAADKIRVGTAEARRRYRADLWSTILAIGRRRLINYIDNIAVPAIAAFLMTTVIFVGVFRDAEPWWAKGGFATNPGYFETVNRVDYPICEAWPKDGLRETDRHLTAANTAPVLLPRSAKVLAIYCGQSLGRSAVAECTPKNCDPALSLSISDSLYTRGRAVTVRFMPKDSDNSGLYWVVWKE